MIEGLVQASEKLGGPGASQKVLGIILEEIGKIGVGGVRQ
jgi:hypothetical protein